MKQAVSLQPIMDEEMEEEPPAEPKRPADKVIKSGGQAGEVGMEEQPFGEDAQDPRVEATAEARGGEGERDGAADSFVAALLQHQANLEDGAAAGEGAPFHAFPLFDVQAPHGLACLHLATTRDFGGGKTWWSDHAQVLHGDRSL